MLDEHTFRIDVWRTDAWAATVGDTNISAEQSKLYFLKGTLDTETLHHLCEAVLVDPVVEAYRIDAPYTPSDAQHSIDVTLQPGVTDPAAESLLHAARVLGIDGLTQAATGERFLIYQDVPADQLVRLAERTFANPIIQRTRIDMPIDAPFVPVQAADDTVEHIQLMDADDDALMAISKERRLSLNLDEMRAIRAYFADEGREPTDAELEMLAQTWSEHCVHKTFKARITYDGPPHGASPDSDPVTQEIGSLLKDFIQAATDKVNKPWVRSAFVDNAGIIAFDDQYDLAFKVETHNRPSALEPFGGANTGVGGVIRDVLGVSARPIANTDILFFGPPDLPPEDLPAGVLSPEQIASGVVAGIEDYGNKMGIPTVNGAIHYDRRYTSNPLVFAGCLGILPHGAHRTEPQVDDLIVVIGGRTGRDGLRGATFSSMEMDTSTSELSGGAVQIGHPIHEKQVLEVIMQARDAGLYNAITDCGAGGLSSAVGEMGEHIGATVHLERVPLKYPGLRPWEIWLSEAQERMVLAVPQENWEWLKAICDGQNIDGTAIGSFTPTGRLSLYYERKSVGDLAMSFLHDGLPGRHMQAYWRPSQGDSPASQPPADEDFNQTLLDLLALPTIRSKEDVIRRYDHEVQGGTAGKPLVGVENSGPGDAAVLVPAETTLDDAGKRIDSPCAVALSVGTCPQYTAHDPYVMSWAAVDEAVRNLVAVGADPDQVAILDNFSWGNTDNPERLGELVRAGQGCYDVAVAYSTPYVSGKDSLNNEYLGADGKRHAIPGTLVVSALGIVPDVTQGVRMDFKAVGNRLYLLGKTGGSLAGSHYHMLHDIDGGRLPGPVPDAIAAYRKLHGAIQAGYVAACHDLSEGGLAVAAAEMCIGGGLGANLTLDAVGAGAAGLFAEDPARLLIEVPGEQVGAFEAAMADVPLNYVGQVTARGLRMTHGDRTLIDVDNDALETAFRGHVTDSYGKAENKTAGWAGTPLQGAPRKGASGRIGKPRVLILHANGTNRDHDAVTACKLAGGEPEIVHVNQLFSGERRLLDYHMLLLPGGFSYGDDLGAGVLWALDLRERLGDPLETFIDEGRPVMGICNGFQTLVKAGLLPGDATNNRRTVTLTDNQRGQFECRWVHLQANPGAGSAFTEGVADLLYIPVAHGEGRVLAADDAALAGLWESGAVALRYVDGHGNPVGYPGNPNGSALDIAGLTNAVGNVFGLMPHPEDHVFPWQHPRYGRDEHGRAGLRLFENGIRFA